ncbi:MAG: hypothetical protein ACR2OE_04040 [Thermomicrobiales bacterium]
MDNTMAAYEKMSINDLRALIIRLRAAQSNPRLNETNRANIDYWIIAALDAMNVARGIA